MKLQRAFFGILLVTSIGLAEGQSEMASIANATSVLNSTMPAATASIHHTISKIVSATKTTATHSASASVKPPPPTTVPTHATTEKTPTAASTGRKFDASSFIGGIVLGIVFVLLGLWAYRWYEKRNRSYHSL